MKDQHRMAALLAARNLECGPVLPPGVTSVAATLGTPVRVDRTSRKRTHLYAEHTVHLDLDGQFVVGGVLSPRRAVPVHRGATPLPTRRRWAVWKAWLAFLLLWGGRCFATPLTHS